MKKLANAIGGLRSKLLLLINICLDIYCGDNVTKLSPVPAAHWTAPVNNRWGLTVRTSAFITEIYKMQLCISKSLTDPIARLGTIFPKFGN